MPAPLQQRHGRRASSSRSTCHSKSVPIPFHSAQLVYLENSLSIAGEECARLAASRLRSPACALFAHPHAAPSPPASPTSKAPHCIACRPSLPQPCSSASGSTWTGTGSATAAGPSSCPWFVSAATAAGLHCRLLSEQSSHWHPPTPLHLPPVPLLPPAGVEVLLLLFMSLLASCSCGMRATAVARTRACQPAMLPLTL